MHLQPIYLYTLMTLRKTKSKLKNFVFGSSLTSCSTRSCGRAERPYCIIQPSGAILEAYNRQPKRPKNEK